MTEAQHTNRHPGRRWDTRPRWHRHPAVRSGDRLTKGERAADALRNGMGSWGFVIGAVLFLIGWTIGNGRSGFDPFPFILLNLILSCLAALQGAILLIAARRSDQIASELAEHDYQTDTTGVAMLTELMRKVDDLHAIVVPGPPPRELGTDVPGRSGTPQGVAHAKSEGEL